MYVYILQFSWVYSWAGLLSGMSLCVLVFVFDGSVVTMRCTTEPISYLHASLLQKVRVGYA